ncbi:DUF1360 domain-containing protein [Nocardia shimofusensis]|uniref:DUF1360 domain-containing protein n=1 Tax=Nocardia shimofusensis TaxID=228596 RepID=UPI00082DD8AB|nr:DUF1360 domain-containing protein [Nocardia shimofusensis]
MPHFRDRDSSGENRTLGGYLATLVLYGMVVAGVVMVGAVTGRQLPARMSVRTVLGMALATHKVSRLVTKGAVTAPVRAPFTTPSGADGGPGEVMEQPKADSGFAHSLGELLSCPFCLDVWVVTGFVIGQAFAPRATRVVIDATTALAGADFLHLAYATAQQIAEGEIPLSGARPATA